MSFWVEEADAAIKRYEYAGKEHAAEVSREMDLEADRHARKQEALRRIMETINPLTNRQHSASSAEQVVETDPEYRAYLQLQSEVAHRKHLAFTKLTAERLRAELALAALHAEREVTA